MTEADDARSAVLAAREAWIEAHAARNAQALDELLCADLLYLHASGKTQDKAAYMKDAVERGEHQNFTNVEVRLFGDTAVVSCLMPPVPGRTKVDAKHLQVWVKEGGRWKMAARQAMEPRQVV